MKTKICSKCKEKKDISEFWKHKRSKDGLYCWCKKCWKEYGKKYYQKNKERISKHSREYRKKHPVKHWCRTTIRQHKHKGFKVLFNFKDLIPIAKQTKYCSICDIKLKWGYDKGRTNASPTLDRINNGKILTLNNIQIICYKCNATKRDRTMKEFIEYCNKVSKKFKKGE